MRDHDVLYESAPAQKNLGVFQTTATSYGEQIDFLCNEHPVASGNGGHWKSIQESQFLVRGTFLFIRFVIRMYFKCISKITRCFIIEKVRRTVKKLGK